MTATPQFLNTENTVIDLLVLAGVASIVVNGTGVVYTKHFALPRNVDFGLLAKIASPGVVNVKVEFEEGNTIPTDSLVDASALWAVGQTISAGLVVTGPACLAITPVVAKYGRLKLTGLGSNDAGTNFNVLQIGISKKRS